MKRAAALDLVREQQNLDVLANPWLTEVCTFLRKYIVLPNNVVYEES